MKNMGRGECSSLGQMKKKKNQNSFLSIARKKNIFATRKKEIQCIFFDCPRIVKNTEIFLSDSAVIFYVLCNNFFYTRLA